MSMTTAVYVRVSSRPQDAARQGPDLKRWVGEHPDEIIKWYRDKFTGKTVDRPGFARLLADVAAGKVRRIVVWRLDRLGRTAKDLTALFEDLRQRGVDLVSLQDGLELSTPAGRLMSNVLTSVAAYETEARAERILAGQHAAREAGKRWGGSEKGRRLKVTLEQEVAMRRMKAEGEGISAIARATGLSRPTIYRVLSTSVTKIKNVSKPRSRRRIASV
jgi:DNA invertase Pin-like site-specific DNA recombinase